MILFTDRVEFLEKCIKKRPKAIPIYGKTDTEAAINRAKSLDSFLIIGMRQCCGEGFDIPEIEVGINSCLMSDNRGALIQMSGRSCRFHDDKQYGRFVDV